MDGGEKEKEAAKRIKLAVKRVIKK